MANRDFLFTYAPHVEDRKLFLQSLETGQTLYDKVIEKIRDLTEYFVASSEHETTNMHWHFSGRLKEEHSSHGKDWLPRILRPMFPKVKSTTKATDCKWSDNIIRSMAYCQKEHGDNIIYHNITDEQKKEMDEINASVPERDLVTYNIIKSKDKFCCAVMRLCEDDTTLRSQVFESIHTYGALQTERTGLFNNQEKQTIANLIRFISPHNLIYSGRWDTVITTLLAMFYFRGWTQTRNY